MSNVNDYRSRMVGDGSTKRVNPARGLHGAQFVILVDPETGLPIDDPFSGGGAGGGGSPGNDASGAPLPAGFDMLPTEMVWDQDLLIGMIKTQGVNTWRQTLEYDSADNLIKISAWTKL